MNDMSPVIVARSDQLNADDLMSGPRTVTITGVDIAPGTEQPVTIHFGGDEGRPWKPCKSMSRVLVAAWGADAKNYAGRSVTLFRDPTVKWGGMEVGGIRISHLSHIDSKLQLALTATRGKKAPFIVQPLTDAPKTKTATDPAGKWAAGYIANVNGAADMAALDAFANEKAKKLAELEAKRPELHADCVKALEAKRAALTPDDDDGWGESSSSDDDWGDTTDQPEAAPSEAEEAIARMIANAMGRQSWEAAKDELNRRKDELSADAFADLDKALEAKKRDLGG